MTHPFYRPFRLAKHRPWKMALMACAASVVAGCTMIPTYERPALPVAAQWPESRPGSTAQGANALTMPWQDFVQEAHLRTVIQLALENNRDLRVAIKSIEQAQAQYRVSRADLLPTVNATVAGSRSAPNASTLPNAPSVASNYTAAFSANAWEIDFFGRLRSLNANALARYLATEEARKAAQISLIGAVSSAWLNLQADSELLALAERTLATREQSLALIRLRVNAGASSALDLQQAESLSETARATVAQQRRLRAQDINALTLLVGQEIPDQLLPSVPPASVASSGADARHIAMLEPMQNTLSRFADISAGVSSEILLRRPDIVSAEQRLIAANANIGAARAAFFPRIALTASYGRASPELSDLFGGGAMRAWTFLPQLALPIFDMGRNRANLRSAEAGRDIAVAQYEKAIQTGFREVADALAGRATLIEQMTALEAVTSANRESYRLADLRYRNGIASYLYLLDAQRALFASEQALTQIRLLERLNQVELYKALGGGWMDTQAANVPAAAASAL